MLIVRETEEADDQVPVVDSTPTVATQPAPITLQHDSYRSAYVFVCCSLLLILSTIAFQCYLLCNPPVATVTIMPRSQTVTLSGTMQLGRVLPPLTISQSQTTRATGKGHQDARAATGTVTFFNGLFTQQFVASGTIYTGQDEVAIVTTQDATIPPGSPSTGYGTLTIPAQAMQAGSSGNIQSGDINITINNGLLVRNSQFYNGQDQRDYQYVTRSDITHAAAPLKATLTHSIAGALQGQLKESEQLQLLPCSPSVSSTHQPGDEATSVTVTVSETCSAVAYNTQELETKATDFLTRQAGKKLAGYSVYGTIQVAVKQAAVANTPPHLVFLSFQATGTWIYGISTTAQQQIKHLIAGKTNQQAQQLLAALPGIEQATIRFSGFGDASRMPKQASYILLSIIVV